MIFKGFNAASGSDDPAAAIHKVAEINFVGIGKFAESRTVLRQRDKHIAVIKNAAGNSGNDIHIQFRMTVKFKHPQYPSLAFGVADVKSDPDRAVNFFREFLENFLSGGGVDHTVENTVIDHIRFGVETGGGNLAFAVVAEKDRRMVGVIIMFSAGKTNRVFVNAQHFSGTVFPRFALSGNGAP